MATPDERMPQSILDAILAGRWDDLRALDAQRSVLMDLWSLEHLHSTQPPRPARISRLTGGASLLEAGFRLLDERGTALELLLAWPTPTNLEGFLPEEDRAWVSCFQALSDYGQSLEAVPEPDFESWCGKDVWASISKKSEFQSVGEELIKRGMIWVHVPAQPQWRSWPTDPTKALIEETDSPNPARLWVWALEQGYEVAGRAGRGWMEEAAEWDHQGDAIKKALAAGRLNVHAVDGQGLTVLGSWVESTLHGGGFVSIAGLRELLGHDVSVLDGLDSMKRPLSGGVLELLENPAIIAGYRPEDVFAVKQMVLDYRLKGRLNQELPPATPDPVTPSRERM